MTKRIMNKVLSCADDCNIKIYYQDADSVHLNYDDVDKIVEIYMQTNDQELVCDGFGNSHVYFSMDGAVIETYGIESVVLR